jgi:tRNA (guanine37-N1)-methyltransferase
VGVRLASAEDIGELARVAAATFPLACPPHTSDEAKAHFIATHLSEAHFAEYLADPARIVLVAADDAEPAFIDGYTMLVLGEPGDPDVAAAISIRPSCELSKCYVLPDRHGAGIAASLMQRSLEEAASAGAAGIWLGVNQENGRAQRFYTKHGFARAGTKRFLVGDRYEDDYVYERPLAP